MGDLGASDELLRDERDLFAPFAAAEKTAQKIGAEMEKFGVRADGSPIQYDGADGVSVFLRDLQSRGWAPESEYPGGPTLALLKDGASITLEPGSQFELSGAQHDDVHAVNREAYDHAAEVAPLSDRLGVSWLGLGFHPWAKRADYTFVPKLRYGIMREYLPTRGQYAHDMMLRTATVQANFDYASESDAMRKMRVALRLAPLNAALFANSPFFEGARFGGKSYRAKVWLDVDNSRAGLVPALLRSGATYRDYIDWALSVPMFLIKRNDRPIANTEQTFRDFMKHGKDGHRATFADWQTHLNTLFPEVRLKRTIEVRSADSQNLRNAPALSALWAGLLYDEVALDAADQRTHDFTHEELVQLRAQVWEDGLAAPWRGEPLTRLAKDIVEIARGGLSRRARKDQRGRDETVYLDVLQEVWASGRSPSDLLAPASMSPRDVVAAAGLSSGGPPV
jgi:glutamate--cysteine ligase